MTIHTLCTPFEKEDDLDKVGSKGRKAEGRDREEGESPEKGRVNVPLKYVN